MMWFGVHHEAAWRSLAALRAVCGARRRVRQVGNRSLGHGVALRAVLAEKFQVRILKWSGAPRG